MAYSDDDGRELAMDAEVDDSFMMAVAQAAIAGGSVEGLPPWEMESSAEIVEQRTHSTAVGRPTSPKRAPSDSDSDRKRRRLEGQQSPSGSPSSGSLQSTPSPRAPVSLPFTVGSLSSDRGAEPLAASVQEVPGTGGGAQATVQDWRNKEERMADY